MDTVNCYFRILFLFGLLVMPEPGLSETFREEQMRYPRVRSAVAGNTESVRARFTDNNAVWPPIEIFLRVFKREAIVELWAHERVDTPFVHVMDWNICASSGVLGPKNRQGDRQVPEGIYEIHRFNPMSAYHLSLRLDYPNKADRIRNPGGKHGGDIFIHGNCVTIGCVPLTDAGIEELYIIALEARTQGQHRIPVHLFPCRMNHEGMAFLEQTYQDDLQRLTFWRNLAYVYRNFESTCMLPKIEIDSTGCYRSLASPANSASPAPSE